MATEVRWRRGTTAENDNFTGAEGEITVDIDKGTLRVHDGVTQGGNPIDAGAVNSTAYTNLAGALSAQDGGKISVRLMVDDTLTSNFTQDLTGVDLRIKKGKTLTLNGISEINFNIIVEDGGQVLLDQDCTINGNIRSEGNTSGVVAFDAVTGDETLTVNGGIGVGLWQVFGGSLSVAGSPKINAVYPEWFGAIGGTTIDQNNILQVAINFAENAEIPFLTAQSAYRSDSTLEIDLQKLTWNGNGAKIDFSNASGVTAFKFKSTSDDYSMTRRVIENLHILGPGKTDAGSIAFSFGADGTWAPRSMLRDLAVEQFETIIKGSSNVFVNQFLNCNLYNASTIVYWPSGLSNSGERITFTNCSLFNSGKAIDNRGADIHLIGCSIDYCVKKISCSSGGKVFGTDVFLESGNDTDYWLETVDSHSLIVLKNTRIYIQGDKTSYEIGRGANFDGGIFIDGLALGGTVGAKYNFNHLIKGFGRVKYHQPIINSGPRMAGAENENRLRYGGFEDETIYDWQTEGTAPTISTTSPRTGTYHLRFEPVSGDYSCIRQVFACSPGEIPRFVVWLKGDLSSSSDDFTVRIYYIDHIGNSINPPTFIKTFNSLNNVASFYDKITLSPYVPAPAGCKEVCVTLQKASPASVSDGNGFVDVDDLSVTIS